MSYTARSSAPKSRKFSEIRLLKGAHSARVASPQGCAAGVAEGTQSVSSSIAPSQRTALAEMKNQQAQEAQDADAHAKVQRQRYVQLVVRMSESALHYNSLGLFVDAMLRELLANRTLDVATVAAAATWALNLLSTQGQSGAPLRAIADALLPAVYCDYTPARLDRAPPSIQAQVKDMTTIRCNPYFTHTMYVEQVRDDHTRVDDMVYSLERALQCNDTRRSFVERIINDRRAALMRQVLCAWRAHARRTTALGRLITSQSQRHSQAVAEQCLGAAFHQWKATLEASRNTFLTERLHEAAFQLENAKNQFQLQCYRADRLAQAAKEAKEELQVVQGEVGTLKERIRQLEEEKIQEARAYAIKLSQSVEAALTTVRQYRSAVAVLADLQPPVEFYVTAEAQFIEDEAAREREEEQRIIRESGGLIGAGATPDTSQELGSSLHNDEPPADQALLRWCNSVLANTRRPAGSPARVVRNFGIDFASGEAYLAVLHHVFPESASLMAGQEPNTEYRLRRVKAMCEASGLELILDPDDFIYHREDRVFASLSELYAIGMAKRWQASARKAAARLASDQHALTGCGTATTTTDAAAESQAAEQEDGAAVGITDEAFAQFVTESQDFLAELQTKLAEQSYYEKELAVLSDSIRQEKTVLVRERKAGAPVAVVGDRGTRAFWSLPKKCLDDLRETVGGAQSQRELWKQLIRGPLAALLIEKAPITARFFYFYAGEGSVSLLEFDFWSFVETGLNRSLREAVDKSRISDIFDRVISPQLATAVRTASVRAEMDANTLMAVARREMDVRKVNPTQFAEIVVRIGVAAYANSLSVVDAVRRVFDDLQLPSIANLPPVIGALTEADVRHITEYFSDSIVRVFFHYVRRQENSKVARERNMAQQNGGRFGAVLSVGSLLCVLQDANFLIGSVTGNSTRSMIYAPEDDTLKRPFVSGTQVKNVVQELRTRYIGLQSDEVIFSLFVEVLSVLSHYWCPDPLVPLPRKYAAFLSTLVKQLIAFHTSSTLVLGNPPEVSLQGGKRVDLSF